MSQASNTPARTPVRQWLIISAIVVAAGLAVYVGPFVLSGWRYRSAVRHLVYRADHPAIRDACLALLRARTPELKALAAKGSDPCVYVPANDPAVPPILRTVTDRRLFVAEGSVNIDCGGGGFQDHFALTAVVDDPELRAHFAGGSQRELIPGLYYWGPTP